MVYTPPLYPSTIPVTAGGDPDLPDRVDDVDWFYAARYNELKKEIIALMGELGTLPKGNFGDVKARITDIDGVPWATPAFDAGDFTGLSGTWTVEAGDVATYSYTIINKTMIVSFTLETTTTASSLERLYIKVPAGKTATKAVWIRLPYVTANGSIVDCHAHVDASGNLIQVIPYAGGAFADGVNNCSVRGHIIFEIN